MMAAVGHAPTIDVSTDGGWNEALNIATAARDGHDPNSSRLGVAYFGLVDLYIAACDEREILRTQLDTERSRNRVLEAKFGAMADKAQVAANEGAIAREQAAERLDKLRHALRASDELKLDLSVANERLAFERGRREAAESELAAERHRHQETALLLEAAGVDHSPRRGTAVQLDTYELERPTVDLAAGMPLGTRLAMTAAPCASLAVMADALTPPDRSVLDDCLDDPAVDRVPTVREIGGGL